MASSSLRIEHSNQPTCWCLSLHGPHNSAPVTQLCERSPCYWCAYIEHSRVSCNLGSVSATTCTANTVLNARTTTRFLTARSWIARLLLIMALLKATYVVCSKPKNRESHQRASPSRPWFGVSLSAPRTRTILAHAVSSPNSDPR